MAYDTTTSSLGAAAYAAKAAGLAAPHDSAAVADEVCWQQDHASPAVRDVQRGLPPPTRSAGMLTRLLENRVMGVGPAEMLYDEAAERTVAVGMRLAAYDAATADRWEVLAEADPGGSAPSDGMRPGEPATRRPRPGRRRGSGRNRRLRPGDEDVDRAAGAAHALAQGTN